MGQSYSLRIPYPNGYYFPRITNLNTRQSTIAGEILFAPTASSDVSPPLVTIDSEIRVPVYQQRGILLRDIITEMSNYTVSVDPDLTRDTDGNGVYNDDF